MTAEQERLDKLKADLASSTSRLAELEKMMAGKTVFVRPYIATLSEGFNGQSSPDDIEIMMQMIHKYWHDLRFQTVLRIEF